MVSIKTILLIDDDPDDQQFFKEALNEVDKDIVCYIANNGEDALFKLLNNPHLTPDFIFLDLNMPKMNGKQFLNEIKKNDAFNKAPIIIYSTSSQQQDITHFLHAGVADFIIKPFSFSELCEKLSNVLVKPIRGLY